MARVLGATGAPLSTSIALLVIAVAATVLVVTLHNVLK